MEELEEQNAIHRFWGVHRRSEQRTKKPVCATWGVRMTVLTNDEYRGRQAAAIAMARANSYDVVLAWGRGASTQDHAADVLYLTGITRPSPSYQIYCLRKLLSSMNPSKSHMARGAGALRATQPRS